MPKTILGIQLAPTEALAACLKWGWKGAIVDRVIRFELGQTGTDERGTAPLFPGMPHADTVVAALPSDEVFQRLVVVPFSDRNKATQAAPLEAEESLPMALEELICHVQPLRRDSRRTLALVAAAPIETVANLLDRLRSGGLDPRIVEVEALALVAVARASLGAGSAALVVDLSPRVRQGVFFSPDGPWSFGVYSSRAGDPSLRSEVSRDISRWKEEGNPIDTVFLSGPEASGQDLAVWRDELGMPVEILPLPRQGLRVESDGGIAWPGWAIPLGPALREGNPRTASQINLLQGPFAPTTGVGPWKSTGVQVGIYLLLLLGLWGAGAWIKVSYEETQYRALGASIRDAFRKALPEVKNVVSEIDQMRARVEELEGRAQSLGSLVDREVTTLRILREVSTRIPKDLEVEFRDLSVEEGRIRVEGVTGSFDAIDRIKAELATFPRFSSVTVSDAKAGVERDKVIFKLAINLGKKG